jgi:aerobic carbon-monoxide dehydrogenase medium subunit
VKAAPFDYVAPGSVDEAISALAGARGEAKVLAGGQSLIPVLAFRLARPSLLVDLNRIPELSYLRESDDGGLTVGAMTRTHELEISPLVAARWPLARDAAPHIGHRQIRNRGTVGGSIAHADPAAELPAVALATRATIVVRGPRGQRTISASEFFVSVFTTALASDEVVTEIRIPPLPRGSGTAFVEVSRRQGDFALAGAAATVTFDGTVCARATLVLIGVGASPIEIPVAGALRGTGVGESQVAVAAEQARALVDPSSDIHGNAAYRTELATVVGRRALLEAARRARAA